MTNQLNCAQTDLEHFTRLWKTRSGGVIKHTPILWDERAARWIDKLSGDNGWQRKMHERILKTANYLRTRGLLGKQSSVVDVGCGPGLFAAEFAKTAGAVTGIDYSKRFVEYAQKNALRADLQNTNFIAEDFLSLDIEEAGYTCAFDLVFASNTPAASGLNCLEKLISMSRAFCCNSTIVHGKDDLLERVSHDVFQEEYRSRWDGNGFYALLNLLWLQGYYPETSYYSETNAESITADMETAREIAVDCGHPDPDSVSQVLNYLHHNISIMRNTEHKHGIILWDIRNRDDRKPKTE